MDLKQIILMELKEKGVRLTPQRQAILEFLKGVDTHPNAEEVYLHIRDIFPGISLGTIYNTLNMLRDKGIIQELSYGDTFSRFDGNAHPHYHIVCENCGKVEDFHRPQLSAIEQEASLASGYLVKTHRLELYGLCPMCRNAH